MNKRHFQGEHTAALFPVLAYAPGAGIFLLDDRSLGFAWRYEPMVGADPGRPIS